MKKILYFSVVPWGWIKQRPHFLTEGLAKEFIVDFYAEVGINSKYYIEKYLPQTNLKLKRLLKLPLIKWYSEINNFLVSIQIKSKFKYQGKRIDAILRVSKFSLSNREYY